MIVRKQHSINTYTAIELPEHPSICPIGHVTGTKTDMQAGTHYIDTSEHVRYRTQKTYII